MNIPSKENGWIEWEGGECPVEHDKMLQVKLRDGSTMIEQAGDYRWSHEYQWRIYDIIAYRVVKE